MANPSGTTENLTKFQPKWKHGKTQTIRVPIALTEQLLTLARKLDDNNTIDSLDTVNDGKLTELYERNGKLTRQSEKLQVERSKLQESLDTAEDTIADLKNELANLSSTQAANLAVSSELEQLKAQLAELRCLRLATPTQISSQTAPQVSENVELPDAAIVLSRLRAKRKKSKADLGDVETILDMMPEQSPPKLPDLYAARDKLFEMPSLGGWKFQNPKERDRLFAFADAFIDQASRLNQDYPLIERLKSDLKQSTERCEGYSSQLREKIEIVRKLEMKNGQQKY